VLQHDASSTAPASLGKHFVQFYRREESLLDEVADFIDAALRMGEGAVVIATPEHRIGIEIRLERARSAAVPPRWYPAEYMVLDAAQTLDRFMVEGWPDPARFFDVVGGVIDEASRGGVRSVSAFGEMVTLLCNEGRHDAAVRLEELWNELGQRRRFSLFCAYPLQLFTKAEYGRAFQHVCANHTHVLPMDTTLGDAGSDERDRSLAELQQKAAALEAEVERRWQAERLSVQREKELADAHAEQARLLDRLQSASRAKDEFLAMLGHELRNPLAPIVTALQLMKMRGDGHTQKEQEIIQRQVDHLIRLVDDLLDVSKITRGKIELRHENVEIGDVIGQAIEMASSLFEQRRHRLVVHVPSQGLRWVGDPIRLAQVVSNLLTNAARYTPTGGEVRLSAFRDTTQVVISVQDNGNGIAPQMLSRVFDLFVQSERGIDRAEGGLGIGLALVKSLVTMHGGTVSAKSDGPGRGSEFVVRLPLNADASGTLGTRRPVRASGKVDAKQVLVVDDNTDAAEMLASALVAAGHDVQVAHDPVSALRLVSQHAPQVAVLDIGLPAMDGYELAARLRARLGETACRLIALTGYGQESDLRRSRDAGFEAHLVKPVDMTRLLALVDGRETAARDDETSVR